MKMNNMQHLAATGRFDKDVLVSAGAGSGKTQVLTTRVKEIIKSGTKPTELLVLTFTNAAAAEMKERVRDSLIKDNVSSDIISELEQAYITTFDSFNLSICRKYFYALNISPMLKICDENAIMQKKKEILTEIIEELYISKDEVLFYYLDKFTDKKDDQLFKNILHLIKSIDLKEDSVSFLNNYENIYFSHEYLENLKNKFMENVSKYVINLKENIKLLINECGNSKSLDVLNSYYNKIINSNTYDDYMSLISVELPKKSKADCQDFSNQRKLCVKSLSNLKSVLEYESLDELVNDYLNIKPTVLLFVRILKKYYKKLNEFKDLNNVYEFNDVQKLAIKLVKENEDIREEIKSSFKEILIDEYQDTSDLQEIFISYIRNDNLFMVGDIKQSIYRFRNANPDIFKNKYETFYSIDESYLVNKVSYIDKPGYLIDMNQNYRSRREVLDDINSMFNILMTNEIGDADYKHSHNMVFGLSLYEDMKCSEKKGFNADYIIYSNDELGISDSLCEAYIIANDIKNKIGSYKVYSKKENKYRPAKYSDFCILIDRQTKFDEIRQVLEYFGIPVSIKADEKIKESYVSMVIINLLKLVGYSNLYKNDFKGFKEIENDYFHSLASILRSFIYEYSDEDVLKIVKNKDLNNEASQLALELSKHIDKMDNGLLYQIILNSYDFYKSVIKMADTNKSLHEAEFLSNKCKSLSDLGYNFIDIALSLGDIMKSSDDIKYSLNTGDTNAVKMMNIHKSKGLEFPICYYCDLSHDYNTDDLKYRVGFDSEYGIYVPLYKGGITRTESNKFAFDNWTRKTVSERLRLFYVALTRAREKMIFIKNVSKNPKDVKSEEHKSFAQYFEYLEELNYNFKNKIEIPYNYFDDFIDVEIEGGKNKFKLVTHKPHVYEPLCMNNVLVNESRISKTMTKIMDSRTQDIISKGLEYHEALEMLDMTRPFESLQELEVSANVKQIIKNILNIDVMKNISNAKALKEHEFSCIIDNESYHGIIDLLLVYDDHIDIIDYKLKNFDDEAYDRQLSIYKAYVNTKTSKPINCYLLSIIDATTRKVNL